MRHTYKINRWYTHRIFSCWIILLIMYCRGHYKNLFPFPAHISGKVGGQKHAGWCREATCAELKLLQATCKAYARESVGPSLSSKSLSQFGSPRKQAQRRSASWAFAEWCPRVQHLWRKWQKLYWAEGELGCDSGLGLTSRVVPSWVSGPAGLNPYTFSSPPQVPLIFSK